LMLLHLHSLLLLPLQLLLLLLLVQAHLLLLIGLHLLRLLLLQLRLSLALMMSFMLLGHLCLKLLGSNLLHAAYRPDLCQHARLEPHLYLSFTIELPSVFIEAVVEILGNIGSAVKPRLLRQLCKLNVVNTFLI
jgi:hypothetical protein